jgi:hypothetical protein
MGTGTQIRIIKVAEDDVSCDYEYRPYPYSDAPGLVRIFKADGRIEVVLHAANEFPDARNAYHSGNKLFWHWRKGEFPDQTSFAS